ncbi:MAG: bifunctional DNA-formamidopyrimidine glycosylase/DNA-(apurinic or apyrimidinic site) lyase [Alphaproteobacteria bacterium]|nr:bifunctional DNA-formamidopyrimidine glycosylase/DNA-(apurinic or apyrimidinic site) lyase [Alphaproteobacteria bacterium]
MPELPEVEIVKRGLEGALLVDGVGARIDTLTFNRPNLRVLLPVHLPDALKGQRFSSFTRRGKYVVAFVESGAGFILHLGMSGVVKIIPKDERYIPAKHDHVVFKMDDGGHVVFNDPRRFGFLKATTRDDWQFDDSFRGMGPEPLSNGFNGPILAERLKGRSGPIKTALLDQKIVAGVGNIYACEALYMAGISPKRSAGSVQGKRAERLAAAIVDVLTRAIESGGSSLKDYYQADGSLGYFQHSFKVYDREGDIVDGKHPVVRIVQSGRSTFYCPAKQR